MNRISSKLLIVFGFFLFVFGQEISAVGQDVKKAPKKTAKKAPIKSKKKSMSRVGDTVVIHNIHGEDDLKNTLSMASAKKLPVLIKVYLTGCPACEHVKPLFDEVSREQSGKALFLSIDATSSANSKFMDIFGIGAVPTFISLDVKALAKRSDLAALKKVANIKSGALSKTEMVKLIGSHKKAAK